MSSDIGIRPKVAARVDLARSPPTMPSPTVRAAFGIRSPSPTRLAAGATSLQAPRPKAKVSSSATSNLSTASRLARSPSVSSNLGAPTAARSPPPLRAPSPFKSRGANGAALSPSTVSAPSQVKARVTVRAPSGDFTPGRGEAAQPDLRSRVSTARLGSSALASPRQRSASITSAATAASSLSSLRTPVGRSTNLPSPGVSPGVSPVVPPRVTAKLSNSARKGLHKSSPSAGSSPLPSLAANELTTRPGGSLRVRTPSIARAGLPAFEAPSPLSPSLSLPGTAAPSPPFVYPITTGNPAAHPHRFASPSPRHAFPPISHVASPASALGSSIGVSSNDRVRDPSPRLPPSLARVESLPPTSPPGSALSFSSRSSASSWAPVHMPSGASSPPLSLPGRMLGRHSLSGAPSPTQDSPSAAGAAGLLMTLIDAPTPTSATAGDGDYDDTSLDQSGSEVGSVPGVHNQRAEAKSNRKIADLEISNRSLLTINSSLEQSKHRQAREIRDLRRKLRESKLALPPRAYKLMREREREDGVPQDSPDEEEEEETEDSDADADLAAHDEGYLRVRSLVDSLLTSARAALADTPTSVLARDGGGGGARVLSAEEVHSWNSDGHELDVAGGLSPGPGDLSMISEGPSTLFDDGDHLGGDAAYASFASGVDESATHSEDEVERSLLFDLGAPDVVRNAHFLPRSHSPTLPITFSNP